MRMAPIDIRAIDIVTTAAGNVLVGIPRGAVFMSAFQNPQQRIERLLVAAITRAGETAVVRVTGIAAVRRIADPLANVLLAAPVGAVTVVTDLFQTTAAVAARFDLAALAVPAIGIARVTPAPSIPHPVVITQMMMAAGEQDREDAKDQQAHRKLV